MPISDWFKAREARRYVEPTAPPSDANDVPDGVWVNCDACRKIVYQGDLDRGMGVCPHCGHHAQVAAPERISMLVDAGSFSEIDEALRPIDPLSFEAGKSYADALAASAGTTGLREAIVTGVAAIEERPVVVGAMDFRFVGGSMGSVVGEKTARAFELALERGIPLVLVVSSGGARMQESMLSLMQMAKTAAAAERLAASCIPYIAVITDPTMGGVTASFVARADVILAEPGARVGFAGPRLVEQTIRRPLPRDFQSSEFMLAHGMIDSIVPRAELRETIGLLLDYVGGKAS